MSGFTYAFRIINSLETIIILFIRYVLNNVFCEKEPSDKDKIEKTLTTMLPSDRILKHQYYDRNYQHYPELLQDLFQAENYDELTMRNHHQHTIGTTPLPKVNYSSKDKEKVDGQNNHPKNSGKSKKDKRNKHKKNKSKEQSLGKGNKPFKCHHRCGPNHIAKKCNIPNTWLTCTINPLKRLKKIKVHLKLTSMLHPMRLQLRVRSL
jgi:hypothetical protein